MNIYMRVPGGGNTLLVISLLFSLLLLNYFNLVPLSKLFPFLSFLPEKSVDEISKTAVVPTPTPLPPITIKKIDPVKKTGEFVINEPSPKLESLSLEKQIIIDGVYATNSKKITVQASSIDSYRPLHSPPLFIGDSSTNILLRVEMIVSEKLVYQTFTSLTPEEENTIPFSVELPFYKSFQIKIYSQSSEILLSQQISL